jgi:hypothetical protein
MYPILISISIKKHINLIGNFYYISYFIKICKRTQRMDRVWMYDLARIDPVYIENIRHFVEEAMRHANR